LEETLMTDPVKLPPKSVLKFISRANVFIYRLSGGRLWNTMQGSPICLVSMTGRKSGRRITMPLMYTPHGEDVLIVASLGGAPKHPVWYHNIVANPEVSIQVGNTVRNMLARQADAAEKAKLWPVLVASYPDFDNYQKATDRDIPVIVCEPG
jgi:F420H(2)-dependent quinone reductase